MQKLLQSLTCKVTCARKVKGYTCKNGSRLHVQQLLRLHVQERLRVTRARRVKGYTCKSCCSHSRMQEEGGFLRSGVSFRYICMHEI